MPYIDQAAPHAGSAEVLVTGMFDEPAGTLARTIPRGLIGSGALAAYTTGGQVAVRGVPLPAGLPVRNLATLLGTTAAVGPTHFWMALLDQFLNVLAVTADNGAGAQGASALMSLPVTVPLIIPFTGLYYVAASSSASTTAPTSAGATLATGVASTVGSPVLCGSAGTQAAPPAVGSQLNAGAISSNGAMNLAAWIS